MEKPPALAFGFPLFRFQGAPERPHATSGGGRWCRPLLAEGLQTLDDRLAERHPAGHSYGPDGPSERLVNVPPTSGGVKRAWHDRLGWRAGDHSKNAGRPHAVPATRDN